MNKRKSILLSIAVAGCVFFLVSYFGEDQKTLSSDEIIQAVKNDCYSWCEDNEDLEMMITGRDERNHIIVGIVNKLTHSPDAGFHVNPRTGEITRKFILNGEYQAIEDGIKESASLIKDVTFSKVDGNDSGTSKILGIAYQSEEIARYRGSLITLFGEPNNGSTNSEQVFTYIIKAQRSDGSSWILTAYEGQSGFAIGGTKDIALSTEMAYLLKQKLDATVPSDFDEKDITSPDTGEVYSYGCKNGECYAN
ncbi:hypothetical protein PALU110988_14965 [Paenibacillus lupini]|uniref:hypothetical protein n=1 Tax=Paenibacillus lupini TaxID=1450204 RepID=UPI0014206ECA|nr:hypothetical protein [Paenibacillus lupini]NIK25810.1 hypothetical protein [Paenibacillus lupini]